MDKSKQKTILELLRNTPLGISDVTSGKYKLSKALSSFKKLAIEKILNDK